MPSTFTLADVARRLDVPQHRLIHLCEKGVVVPDVKDATGRGSSRVFSDRNVVELAVALRLRAMFVPVSVAGAVVHVLRALEGCIREDVPGFSLTASLQGEDAPDLRVIVSDGDRLYFSLGQIGGQPRLFGGVSLDRLASAPVEPLDAVMVAPGFGGPEGSRFARMELSVTAVAQALPLD